MMVRLFAYKRRYTQNPVTTKTFHIIKKIIGHFPKISEDFRKFSEDCLKFIQSFPIIFRKFPKISEDCRRLPNISEQSTKMFRSYRNKFRLVKQVNVV